MCVGRGSDTLQKERLIGDKDISRGVTWCVAVVAGDSLSPLKLNENANFKDLLRLI